MCQDRFSYRPGSFVDPVEAVKACLGSKLRTQPNIVLIRVIEGSILPLLVKAEMVLAGG